MTVTLILMMKESGIAMLSVPQMQDVTDLPVMDRGAWQTTSTGGYWSIEHPHPRDVIFDDIALGMSRVCRFAGQIDERFDFYAVTEHSVVMTEHAIETGQARTVEDALAILLHDGSEAFYGDMPTPMKELLPGYKLIEKNAQRCIMRSFGLDHGRVRISDRDIKILDWRSFLAECDQLLTDPARNTRLQVLKQQMPMLAPIDCRLQALAPVASRAAFVDCFLSLPQILPARDPAWLDSIAHHYEAATAMRVRMAIPTPTCEI